MRILYVGLLAAAMAQAAENQFSVETKDFTWHDAKRKEREVPVRIYLPQNTTSPAPVIVFSHGLGGTRNGYEYLGRHWASNGFATVHVQHVGSDYSAWRGTARPRESMRAATFDPENSINRPLDVSFVLDQLTALNKTNSTLRGRLDLEHVGMAGHSYGAFTTMAIAGETFGLASRSAADPRVKAAIALSTPVPRRPPEKNFSAVTIPVFHMTGTADDSPIRDTKAADRRIPFDLIQNATQFLVTFDGGDHMIFGGRSVRIPTTKQQQMVDFIRLSTTKFWDAYLLNDREAERWLMNGAAKETLGALGAFESKSPRR